MQRSGAFIAQATPIILNSQYPAINGTMRVQCCFFYWTIEIKKSHEIR